MAMNPAPPRSTVGTDPREDTPEDALLAEAAQSLRARVDPRWVEISDRVLAKVLTATRRSHPVRAAARTGPVHVSEQVLIAYLRDAIDGQVPGSALAGVHVEIEGRDTFSGVTIQVLVQYGRPILPMADRIHEIAAGRLAELLGALAPPVDVRATHVHVSDVTRGDPQTAHR